MTGFLVIIAVTGVLIFFAWLLQRKSEKAGKLKRDNEIARETLESIDKGRRNSRVSDAERDRLYDDAEDL